MKPVVLTQIALGKAVEAQLRERYTLLGPYREPAQQLQANGHLDQVRAVITTGGAGLSRELVERMPQLGVVCAYGVGYEKVDVSALKEKGIALTNGRAGNASCVADLAMALLLAVGRDVLVGDRYIREGRWHRVPAAGLEFVPGLGGARLGILGLGDIGQRVATRGLAFEMEVGYHSRTRRAGSALPYFDDVRSLAEWSDYLLVACPLTPATRGMVNREVLEALGPAGFLVNIARGAIIDQAALIQALNSGTIAAAGLDVLDGEPAGAEQFKDIPNVVLTPHLGGCTRAALANIDRMLMENLQSFFAGAPLLTPVTLS